MLQLQKLGLHYSITLLWILIWIFSSENSSLNKSSVANVCFSSEQLKRSKIAYHVSGHVWTQKCDSESIKIPVMPCGENVWKWEERTVRFAASITFCIKLLRNFSELRIPKEIFWISTRYWVVCIITVILTEKNKFYENKYIFIKGNPKHFFKNRKPICSILTHSLPIMVQKI